MCQGEYPMLRAKCAKIAAVDVEGTGYAISIKTVMPIVDELIEKGYVSRPWLGAE